MAMQKIGVVGAGVMGNGIAQVFAQNGYDVIMTDISEQYTSKGVAAITKNLDRAVSKGKMTEEQKTEILGRLKTSTDVAALADVDLVVESIIEDVNVKVKLFQDLDRICKTGAILSTNTSSISVTRLAAATKRPGQVVGMHFFNPAPVMQLVEVIHAMQTSTETSDAIVELSKKIGKTPVTMKDSYGFIGNRILLPMINEAICCLYEGVTTAESIDSCMKLGMAHPIGPLALADLIGLDVCLHIMDTLYTGFQDPKYRACPLLKQMVDAGLLGKKTGRGFFNYETA